MHNCVPGALIHFTVAQMGSHASQLLLGSMLFLLSCSPPQLHPSISSKTTCLKFLCTFFPESINIMGHLILSKEPVLLTDPHNQGLFGFEPVPCELICAGCWLGNGQFRRQSVHLWLLVWMYRHPHNIFTIFSQKRTLILISSQRNGKALLNCCHYFFHLLK